MQIFTASIGAAGIRTSGEVADGVIPVWMSPERMDLILPYVKEGIAKAGGKKRLDDFSIAPFVTCLVGDDLEKCRMPVKGMLALYIGGMGARSKNFYNDTRAAHCKARRRSRTSISTERRWSDSGADNGRTRSPWWPDHRIRACRRVEGN
jgi:alkanesulfonate monooxygenase SsuD/methylene tetrahydromethanopterin reductase-like flavin-dependent oxidoreductase (luciferase family)